MRMQSSLPALAMGLILALGCVLPPNCQAEDWPQWRGPNRDGVWDADGIVDQLPTGQLPLKWSVEVGPGYNGPTVASGRVFVMDRQTAPEESERVLCFDSKTGNLIWQHTYAAPYTISYRAGPRASVTIDGNRAFAVGAMGHFHCLDATSGKVIWKRDLNTEYSIEMPVWGIAASPIIYKNLVIQQVAGSDGACMVAFEKESGQEVWRALNERAGYSSPILIQQAARDILVCWTGESLSGLDAGKGNLVWTHPMLPSRMPIGIGSPVMDGENIFVSSFYDGSLMVRAEPNSVQSNLIWRAQGVDEKNTAAKSVQLSDSITEQDGPYGVHAMIGTSILQEGFVYAVDSYGEFRCLDATNGKRVWEDLTAVPRNRWATIHMVRQADRVWMFNERGELLLTKLSPKGLEILARSQLIEPTRVQLNRRDGVCWAHPAFAEKCVFARNDNRLVCASLAADQ